MVILFLFVRLEIPRSVSCRLFWAAHPFHVLLSAVATTSMYRSRGGASGWQVLVVGYLGSIGIASLSDSLLPFFSEWALDLPGRVVHLGFIEKWWLVNPLAFAGIALGYRWPRTGLPHAAHVLVSTWASLFHMQMAMSVAVSTGTLVAITAFLFVAVWLPCCTSDIVFPLLFVRTGSGTRPGQTRSKSTTMVK